jgi:hypothetical protein
MDNELSPDENTGSDTSVENTDIGGGGESDWSPNYSFKVKDEDHEFDEWVRPAITNKEHEEKLRDLYTKAYGLDTVKSRAEEYEKKYSDVNSKYGTLNSQWEQMSNGLQKISELKEKDFSTFRKVWQIPDHKILEAASDIMQYMQNPELKAQYDANQERAVQMLQQEQSLAQYNQQTVQMQRQMHDMKMTQAFSDPEVSRFEKEFDKRMGQGAFRQEVNTLGSLQFHNGQYVEPQQLVGTVYGRLKKLIGEAAPGTAPVGTQGQPRAKPIPNMGSGKSGTSTSKKIKTTDDLRRLANSLNS